MNEDKNMASVGGLIKSVKSDREKVKVVGTTSACLRLLRSLADYDMKTTVASVQ